MDTELNKQLTKIKVQAKNAGIDLNLEIKDNLAMIYPKHRDDICGSLGYADKSNLYLVSYTIDLKRMRWAADEGFNKEQIRTDKRLNILKEVRPDALIKHLA